MKLKHLLVLVACMAMTAPALAADTYKIDPVHSNVQFKVRHFVSMVGGEFKDFAGTIVYDADEPSESTVQFTVQAESIDTNNENRDKHLRSPDFFDVEQFPQLSFTSTKVKKRGKNKLSVTGDFTMHGVTKKMTVPVQLLGVMSGMGKTVAGFMVEFEVDRKDFGVNWNRALDQGGFVLGDDVEVVLSIEAVLVEDS